MNREPVRYSQKPFAYRLMMGLVILSVLLSCRTLSGAPAEPLVQEGSSAATPAQAGDLRVSGEIPNLPENVSLAGMAQTEQELRDTLRQPLREVLGADADELFAQADNAYKAIYERLKPQMGAQSYRPRGLAQFEVFGLMFGVMLGFQNSAAESNKSTVQVNDKLELSENANIQTKINFTRNGSKLIGDVEMTLAAGKGDSKLVETAKGKYEVELCPDANGRSKVTFDLSFDTSGSAGGQSAGVQFTFKGSGNGQVNDDAALTGMDLDVTSGLSVQKASAANGGQIQGEFAETRTQVTFSNMQDMNNVSASNFSNVVTRHSSQATQQTADTAANLGLKMSFMFAYFSVAQAERLWQNGYCLEIIVEGAPDGATLRPAERISFTAKVRHKFEGAEITAPMIGSLSGEKSLYPLEKSQTPVDYTYEAPPEKDKEAKVNLESRSKRGVAKESLFFKTALPGYTVSGKIDEFSFSGVICDPYAPFTINGAGGGASAVFNFTPDANSLSGNYTYRGGGGGITLYGSGPYRILPDANGGGVLELGGSGCVNMNSCAEGTDPLQLSPLQDEATCK